MVKYNFNLLEKYCNENNIHLINSYYNVKINRDTKIEGKCKNCINNFNVSFRVLLNNRPYCNSCCLFFSRQKCKLTCLEKYGLTTNLLFTETIEKKNYNLEKNKSEIREKYKKTINQKYNCENISQNNEIKQKILQTNKSKSKVEKDNIVKKRKKTLLQKYGNENIFLVPEIIYKKKQTCIKKYGTENHMHNCEIAEKQSKNSYNNKTYVFPSSNKITYQGYENFALDEIIKNTSEEDIFVSRKSVPIIYYNDEKNDTHRHYVDIYIKSLNKCIEVKSLWTYNKNKTKKLFIIKK
jgi:hypothetical protein